MVKTLSLVERTGTNSVFYLNSFAMDSKQVGKAILVILRIVVCVGTGCFFSLVPPLKVLSVSR